MKDTPYRCFNCGNPIKSTEESMKLFVSAGICDKCYIEAMDEEYYTRMNKLLGKMIDTIGRISSELKDLIVELDTVINQMKKGEES